MGIGSTFGSLLAVRVVYFLKASSNCCISSSYCLGPKWKKLSEYVTLECDGQDMTAKLKGIHLLKILYYVFSHEIRCILMLTWVDRLTD